MSDRKINCPHCQALIQADMNFCPICGRKLNVEYVKVENITKLNIVYSVILSIIIGFVFTFILAFVFYPAYTSPLIYTCLFSYTIYPLCHYKFDFSQAYKKQNIFLRFLIGFILFGFIFGIADIGNRLNKSSQYAEINSVNSTQERFVPNEKSILDYYNDGSVYCSNFKFEGNFSSYYCIVEYITKNASPEINSQLNSIREYCIHSTICNADYQNCIYREINEVSN